MSDRGQQRIERLREAGERIMDPATIEAQLNGLNFDQSSLLMKLYRQSRARLTNQEMATQKAMLDNFQTTAADISGDVANLFSAMGGNEWDLASVRRLGRDRQLFAQIANRIKALGGQVQATLMDGMVGQFKTTTLDNAYRLDAVTPESVGVKFGILPDQMIAQMLNEPWSGAMFSERLGLITDDMAQEIKSEITRSMMAGESWQKTAQRIRGEMGTAGQASVWRAEMVARTELAHAQELANAQFAEDNADVVDDEIWVAHPGACDAICVPNHGRPVSEVGRPPDDSHPNCVCDVLIVPKSFDQLMADADGPMKTPPSRTAWAKANQAEGLL